MLQLTDMMQGFLIKKTALLRPNHKSIKCYKGYDVKLPLNNNNHKAHSQRGQTNNFLTASGLLLFFFIFYISNFFFQIGKDWKHPEKSEII